MTTLIVHDENVNELERLNFEYYLLRKDDHGKPIILKIVLVDIENNFNDYHLSTPEKVFYLTFDFPAIAISQRSIVTSYNHENNQVTVNLEPLEEDL